MDPFEELRPSEKQRGSYVVHLCKTDGKYGSVNITLFLEFLEEKVGGGGGGGGAGAAVIRAWTFIRINGLLQGKLRPYI